MLRSNPAEARPILRRLLAGRLRLTPQHRPEGRFYEFTDLATYGAMLSGVVGGLVPPGEIALSDTVVLGGRLWLRAA